jgi:hypothetical protein
VLYPGAKAGPVEFPPSLPVAAPLELLSFVAAATERTLLGTAAGRHRLATYGQYVRCRAPRADR